MQMPMWMSASAREEVLGGMLSLPYTWYGRRFTQGQARLLSPPRLASRLYDLVVSTTPTYGTEYRTVCA